MGSCWDFKLTPSSPRIQSLEDRTKAQRDKTEVNGPKERVPTE